MLNFNLVGLLGIGCIVEVSYYEKFYMYQIALIAYLFWGDGILRCSEADSTNLRGAEETSP